MVNSAMRPTTWWAVLPSAKHTQEHHRLPLQVSKWIHRVQFFIKGWYHAKISILPLPASNSTHPHRCKYLEHLNLSGLDEHSTPADYNDLLHSAEVEPLILMLLIWTRPLVSPQVKEHYLNLIEDALRELPSLVNLNLGTLVNNGILRIVSKTCPRYCW